MDRAAWWAAVRGAAEGSDVSTAAAGKFQKVKRSQQLDRVVKDPGTFCLFILPFSVLAFPQVSAKWLE